MLYSVPRYIITMYLLACLSWKWFRCVATLSQHTYPSRTMYPSPVVPQSAVKQLLAHPDSLDASNSQASVLLLQALHAVLFYLSWLILRHAVACGGVAITGQLEAPPRFHFVHLRSGCRRHSPDPNHQSHSIPRDSRSWSIGPCCPLSRPRATPEVASVEI